MRSPNLSISMTSALSISARVLVAALLLPLSLVGLQRLPAGEGELFYRGDVDFRAGVDVSDAVNTFSFLFLGSFDMPCLDAGDANDDGALDLSDGVFTLEFLFAGGPNFPPPTPGAACPGTDPTPDALGCDSGLAGRDELPSATVSIVVAPPPGVRQRQRERVTTTGPGQFVVQEGHDFAILVEARSHPISRRPFDLATDGDEPRGRPEALDVRADVELLGVQAGENLAHLFARDIDNWADPIHLLEQTSLLVPGADGPPPGEYRIDVRVTDSDCATSSTTSIEWIVWERASPRLRAWLESVDAPGVPLQQDPGSGHARFETPGATRVVIEALPRGRGDPAPVPGGLIVFVEPAWAVGPDLTQFLVPVDAETTRWALPLDEVVTPVLGNSRLSLLLGPPTAENFVAAEFVIARVLEYAADIQPIWTINCTGCHEQPDPFRGLVVVDPDPSRTRRNIVNVFATEPDFDSIAPRLVRPWLPANSYLWRKLEGTHLDAGVLGEGGRMPQGGALNDAELHLVESWILEGAGE